MVVFNPFRMPSFPRQNPDLIPSLSPTKSRSVKHRSDNPKSISLFVKGATDVQPILAQRFGTRKVWFLRRRRWVLVCHQRYIQSTCVAS
ncbi:unnamed protein product [Rhodiola kirilowii]